MKVPIAGPTIHVRATTGLLVLGRRQFWRARIHLGQGEVPILASWPGLEAILQAALDL